MIILRKLLFVLFFSILSSSPIWAEETKPDLFDSAAANTLNANGNNDGVQEGVDRIGRGFSYVGQRLVDKGSRLGLTNPNIPGSKVDSMVKTGVRVMSNGKVIENVAKAAPHVGWIASTAGKLDAGDRTGAAITATNGLGRTIAVGWAGAAAGVAVVGGSVAAAPVALGFVVGCGVAWGAGKIWDYTVGSGAEVLDQKVHDLKAELSFGQTSLASAQRNIRKLKWSARKEVDNTETVLSEEGIETGEGSVDKEVKGKNQVDSAKKKKLKEENKEREKAKKQAEKIRKKVKEQLVKKKKEEQSKKAEEARERLRKKSEEAKERLKKKIAESKKEERERREKRKEKKLLAQKEKSYKDMTPEERREALKRNDDEAWEALQKDLLGESDDEDTEEEKTQVKSDIPPIRIVTRASYDGDYSAGKFKNIVTTTITLSFWNVGSQVAGYGGATMKSRSVASLNGVSTESSCTGTFSGGPNGVIHLYGDCAGSTLNVNGGASVSGGGMSFSISNPSAFQYWDH